MIRITVKQGLLGADYSHHEVEALEGLTARRIADEVRAKLPGGVGIVVAVDGRALETEAELDAPLRDGQHIAVAPVTAGEGLIGTLVYLLIQAVISFAVGYLIRLLLPTPKPPGVAQERGDASSQTYQWDGIKTNYGAGLPVPWVYGEHAVGGQVIWTDTNLHSSGLGIVDDRLRILLSLCEGPVHSVGGLQGERNGAGLLPSDPFPTGVIVDGNLLEIVPGTSLGALAWTRPGHHDQSALPPPFTGISSVITINQQIAMAQSAIATYTDGGQVVHVKVLLAFPSGLYEQGTTGQAVATFVSWQVQLRVVGTGVTGIVSLGSGQLGTTGPHLGYFARTLAFDLSSIWPGGLADPFEIEVRINGPITTTVVNHCLWRDLVVQQAATLRYPSEALLGLELWASARFSGGLPQLQVPVRGLLVRVWDETIGWSPRCWDVPAAPFDFNTHPPGRNPAWCLLDYLLSRWGLGEYLTEDDVDLPAFRRWAAFCDSDPNPDEPWDEPAFTVDIVGDRPRPAWEWVLAFCAAGRAAPVLRNGKLSVIYQYRDEHGDAGITVPARVPTQLLTSGNVEDVTVRWLSKNTRPTVYLFQYLDETDLWQQDVLPVEDPGGSLNDPTILHKDTYRSETVQAYGVTRAQQLFREGRFKHAIARLADREIAFVAGPWTLAAEVGDLIDFEHELLRPFGDDVPIAVQVPVVDDATHISIDHDPDAATHIMVRGVDGKGRVATIDSATQNGTLWDLVLEAPGLDDVAPGATAVLGVVDKLVETYQIVAITLRQDLKREVRAIQWVPDAYDPIEKSEWDDSLRGSETQFLVLDPPPTVADVPEALGLTVVRDTGGHRITIARPREMVGKPASVFAREVGTDTWRFVATTDADSLVWGGFAPHVDYELSVVWPTAKNVQRQPEQGDRFAVQAEEFPPWSPPALTKARAVLLDDTVLVQADALETPDLDCYELAVGSSWAARRVLARERFPRFHLQVPAGPPLLVTAKSTSGLHGPVVVLENPDWSPPDLVDELDEDDLDPSPAGSHDGTEWSDGVLQLEDGLLTGTYTSAEQDAGYQAPRYWQVRWDRREIHDVTVDELAFAVGSGEARWWTVEGRPASAGRPGIDWQTQVDDLALPVSDVPDTLRVAGHLGEVGTHTNVLVESRFYVDGAWGAWREHVDRTVLASRIQVRVRIDRRDTTYRATVHQLSYHAFV